MNLHSSSNGYPPRVLNVIGYWASSAEGEEDSFGWPDPRDLIGLWDSADRKSVINYLSSGIIFRRYFGYAQCRICNGLLGSSEMTDGIWVWPEKLEHYVQAHDVLLPKAFIESARAPACRKLESVREEFGFAERWMEGLGSRMPIGPARARAIITKPNAWLDWAAATIPARPAPDAITFEEAKHLCAWLSHRQWGALIEERFGRWRITCRSETEDNLMYVERCRAEVLQQRVLARRYPDPDALLDPEQAQAVAREFDGASGSVRIVATAPDRWLIWVNPPDCEWPTGSEIQKAAREAELGWSTFRPGGSESFASPPLDELQWRVVLGRLAKSRLSQAILHS